MVTKEPRTQRVFERSKRVSPRQCPLTPLEDSLRARLFLAKPFLLANHRLPFRARKAPSASSCLSQELRGLHSRTHREQEGQKAPAAELHNVDESGFPV